MSFRQASAVSTLNGKWAWQEEGFVQRALKSFIEFSSRLPIAKMNSLEAKGDGKGGRSPKGHPAR